MGGKIVAFSKVGNTVVRIASKFSKSVVGVLLTSSASDVDSSSFICELPRIAMQIKYPEKNVIILGIHFNFLYFLIYLVLFPKYR